MYLFGANVTALFAYPFFWLLDTGSTVLVWAALLIAFTVSHTQMYAPQAAFFSELFGTRVRYTGASLGSQLASVIAGGFSPIIATAILPTYGRVGLAANMVGMAPITITAVVVAVETGQVAMSETA